MALLSPSCLLVVVLVVVMVKEPAALAQCTGPMDPCGTSLNCSGCDAANGGSIPDPDDCHNFYVCVDDTNPPLPLPAICPDGEVFDPEALECSSKADCFTCPQVCEYSCWAPTSPDYISYRYNCNQYYECDGTTPVGPVYCDAETPFFDGRTCQTEETRCCRCRPSCAEGQSVVMDPLDCRNYWLCPNTDPPTLYGTCPNGEVFDADSEVCSALATCKTTCPNVVNTDGCIDPFTCLQTGFFAMCPKLCVDEYYACGDATGAYQESERCLNGTLFNPDSHTCVSPEDCPYPGPESLRVTH